MKDDDFLALGHHKLRFYLTPMVHWPETMMTFDETEGVLFSGDGFGCFGTLDGGFLDTRINTDRYWDEMVRYYSNIVGKYGSPVQKALQKLGGLHITTICSTHGPVWTEYISKVIGIYDKLSRYAADEGVVIAYGSNVWPYRANGGSHRSGTICTGHQKYRDAQRQQKQSFLYYCRYLQIPWSDYW